MKMVLNGRTHLISFQHFIHAISILNKRRRQTQIAFPPKWMRQSKVRNYFLMSNAQQYIDRNVVLFLKAVIADRRFGLYVIKSFVNTIRMQRSVRLDARTCVCQTKTEKSFTKNCHEQIPYIALKITCRSHECNYTHFVHWLSVPISYRVFFFFCIRNDLQNYWNYSMHAFVWPAYAGIDTEEGKKTEKKK